MARLIGVDVGGTFTDVVVLDEGVVEARKVPTSVDQAEGVVGAVSGHADDSFLHGTTAATNALLEERGEEELLDEVEARCLEQASLPPERMVNHVRAIYERFTLPELEAKISELVRPRHIAWDGPIDVAEVREGDPCPACAAAGRAGTLTQARGIEIGHIFQLGRKYAEALDLTVLDENGREVVVTMGSYGIGVSRAVAAVAEQHHDDKGLVWPVAVAPADVHLVATGKDDAVFAAAAGLAADLDRSGLRVLSDDRRGVSPGVKFNDSELIGVPLIVVVGKKLADGMIEVKDRASGERSDISLEGAVEVIVDRVRSLP